MAKYVTIMDIARELGISKSTVSRALSGDTGNVKAETLQKILETAERMGYHRNELAVNFRQQSTHNIGIIIPEIVTTFYMTFINEAQAILRKQGYKVMIAGAGKAAHLPGMCAALFPMPVIGIPMKTSDLGGVDSLYSIVQMPSGIPVATVAINGGKNAGILAAKILATSDPELLQKIKDYSKQLKNEVKEKNAKQKKVGYEKYMEK